MSEVDCSRLYFASENGADELFLSNFTMPCILVAWKKLLHNKTTFSTACLDFISVASSLCCCIKEERQCCCHTRTGTALLPCEKKLETPSVYCASPSSVQFLTNHFFLRFTAGTEKTFSSVQI